MIAASPLIATAASLARAPERFTARLMASPTAFASTMAFSLIEFGGVASAAYDSTRYWPPLMLSSISFTEEVVMSSPRRGRDFAVRSTLFPFSDQTVKCTIGDRTRNTGGNYIQPGVKLNVSSLTKYHRGIPGSDSAPFPSRWLLILGRPCSEQSRLQIGQSSLYDEFARTWRAGQLARRNDNRRRRSLSWLLSPCLDSPLIIPHARSAGTHVDPQTPGYYAYGPL